MYLDKDEKITTTSIQGDNVTGKVTSILENTVIISCGSTNYVISKKKLEIQGYKFSKKIKKTKQINISVNRNLKE